MRKYKYKVTREDNTSFAAGGRYRLQYKQDEITYAIPGTLGIMVFSKRKQAKTFGEEESTIKGGYKIKKVIPIGKGHTPKEIGRTIKIDFYYNTKKGQYSMRPPEGTMCYPGVFVCD
jgi:hypothetical protein